MTIHMKRRCEIGWCSIPCACSRQGTGECVVITDTRHTLYLTSKRVHVFGEVHQSLAYAPLARLALACCTMQARALAAGLLREIAVVQGPPGTGWYATLSHCRCNMVGSVRSHPYTDLMLHIVSCCHVCAGKTFLGVKLLQALLHNVTYNKYIPRKLHATTSIWVHLLLCAGLCSHSVSHGPTYLRMPHVCGRR